VPGTNFQAVEIARLARSEIGARHQFLLRICRLLDVAERRDSWRFRAIPGDVGRFEAELRSTCFCPENKGLAEAAVTAADCFAKF
jgi:hypothetical protein